MVSGTIDSTIPQTSNTVNNTPSYITLFKTAVLNIFGIGDGTDTTQAMTIASTGKVVFTVSPVTITGLATSAGAQTLVVTPGAHTAVIAEVQDVDIEAHTMTITGAITTQRFTFLGQPTITAASALTVTTAATFDIAGPPMPTGAGPCTITNAYGGRMEAGTLTASAATTVDTAASFVIEGAPIRGTNVTITNTYGGLFRDSGAKTLASIAARIENTATSSTASINKIGLSVSSSGTWDGTSANNIGIDIDVGTEGTNDYALRVAQQIQSTLASGTAPFVVASPTVVTNLNADTVDAIEGASLLRSDASDSYTSGTLTLDSGTTLDINGAISIADTTILLDGASVDLGCTGNFSINTDDLIVLKSNGFVGINTAAGSITDLLTVTGGAAVFHRVSNAPLVADRQTDDGDVILIQQAGATEGSISVSDVTVTYGAFVGSHYTQLKDGQREFPVGAVLISTGEIIPCEVTIRGITRDVSGVAKKEYFSYVDTTSVAADKRFYGVWFGKSSNDSIGKSFGQDAKAVYLIAQVGLFKIRVTDTNGNIENGDFLETSTRPKEAQKQTGAAKLNSTIGKAMIDVDWATVSVDRVLGYKWKLIPLTFG